MIPLTVRSYYSLMWGTASPEHICNTAKRLGYNRLALTDTNNLYGLWPFLKSCEKEKISPIIGSEITDPASGLRAVCLVENKTGYQNLCRLITRRHRKTGTPFDLTSVLPGYSKGIVVLTRSVSLLTHWHNEGVTVAAALPRKPDKGSFGLRTAARKFGIPVVATPGSFFIEPDDLNRHRMLRAIDLNTSLSTLPENEKAPEKSWLASPVEYQKRFNIWPEAIKNTEAIAERLAFKTPGNGLVLPPWESPSGESPGKMLRRAAYNGARNRYGHDLSEIVVNRLEHELRIIEQMNFSSYFLVVRDIVSASPRICGRGSGAASLVSYCLGITNVCPVKHNLYFERFLNPGRSDPPDIDIDFAWDERDGVLNTVLEKYRGYAALVCNHVTFKPRMAIREVAKVFGLADHEIGRVSKRLPWFWHMSSNNEALLSHLREMPELKGTDFSDPWPDIIHMAQRIIGLPRYISVHPGGVVITPRPIDTYVPVEPAPKGVPVIQWEKDNTEDAGLVKIDLLGNRSLGVIRDAVSQLKVEEVVSTRRQEMSEIITGVLKEKLAQNGLVLEDFVLRNITFSPEYAASVEQKQIAEQQAQQAALVVDQRKQEAEQARQIAQGQADAVVILAEGEAEAMIIKADAEAKALFLIAEAIQGNEDLLTYTYIQKLSPNIQAMLLPADSPFLFPLPTLEPQPQQETPQPTPDPTPSPTSVPTPSPTPTP